jgi:hypothetical protein
MRRCGVGEGRHAQRHLLRGMVAVLAAATLLAACDTPTGMAPNLRGTYWQNALVTNPNGGGPQIVRWGPPDPFVPIVH